MAGIRLALCDVRRQPCDVVDGAHIELPSRDYRLPVGSRPIQHLDPVACGAEGGVPVGIGRRVLHEGDDGRAQGVFLLAPVPAVLPPLDLFHQSFHSLVRGGDGGRAVEIEGHEVGWTNVDDPTFPSTPLLFDVARHFVVKHVRCPSLSLTLLYGNQIHLCSGGL